MSISGSNRRRTLKSLEQASYCGFVESLEQRKLLAFTIAVIPDTQHMVWRANDQATIAMQWVKDQQTAQNVQFVAGVGDIVNDGGTDQSEWVNAKQAWDV